ncbi:hypothetical protein BDR22DRAFT_860785 [Usnea florida]
MASATPSHDVLAAFGVMLLLSSYLAGHVIFRFCPSLLRFFALVFPLHDTLRPTICVCHLNAIDLKTYKHTVSFHLAVPRVLAPIGNATPCIATFCSVIFRFNFMSSCKDLIFAPLDFAEEGNVTQNHRSTLAQSMAKQKDEASFDRKK